jgi:hypothetical protein
MADNLADLRAQVLGEAGAEDDDVGGELRAVGKGETAGREAGDRAVRLDLDLGRRERASCVI